MLRVGSKLSGTSPQQFKQDQDILKVQITGVVFTATPFLMVRDPGFLEGVMGG